MRPSLRAVLAQSHVAAAAIAILLLLCLDSVVRGVWDPIVRTADNVAMAIATRDIGYIWHIWYFSNTLGERLFWITSVYYLLYAFICFLLAWLFSQWIYRRGPFGALSSYRDKLAKEN